MHQTLQLVLILLITAVLVVTVFRALRLPPMLGYLLTGLTIGPHALNWIHDSQGTSYLAEFGVVFLMFSIGLEFSFAKLKAMRSLVFGLGSLQVIVTVSICVLISYFVGLNWQSGLALGGAIAMSSTAIVIKLLSERFELHSQHGRQIIGILLFQDLAVVPFLILIPALANSDADMLMWAVLIGLGKAALALTVILVLGNKLMRPWFTLVAKRKSSELFMLNVLLITLGLAYLTELSGLSLALGAFLAGMLISETEYRYQVEDVIKPFRDVLLGLFFVTLGMMLDFEAVLPNIQWVLLLLLAILVGKALLIFGLSRFFGSETATSLRVALILAQAGEFSFVLLSQASAHKLVPTPVVQIVLASLLMSMLLAPFIIQYHEWVVRRLCGTVWMNRAKELHEIAVKSMSNDKHVIVCGYGRSGQNISRILETEHVPFIALDLDPKRVRQALTAGESVVYGDAERREVLIAAGLRRASAVVITFAAVETSMKIIGHVRQIRPQIPIIVRTLDDAELDLLRKAGATEVVPEVLEGSVMLASQALLLLGIPPVRVIRRMRTLREQRYHFLRGFFRGATDEDDEQSDKTLPRLQTVFLGQDAYAVQKRLGELQLDVLPVEVKAINRYNIRALEPTEETLLKAGDTLVLMGTPENLAMAETMLLQGNGIIHKT